MKSISLALATIVLSACSGGGNALYVAGTQCALNEKSFYDPLPVDVKDAKVMSVSSSGLTELEPGTYSYVGAEAVFSQKLEADPRDPNKNPKDLIVHVRESKPLGATEGFQDRVCVRNITYAPRNITSKIRVISDILVSDRKEVTFKTKELGFEITPEKLNPVFGETLNKDFVKSSRAMDSRITEYNIYQLDPTDKNKFEIRGRKFEAGRRVEFSVQLLKH